MEQPLTYLVLEKRNIQLEVETLFTSSERSLKHNDQFKCNSVQSD